ncbi:MAG TPA: LysR substrate-binding domain-containing protein [Anaeromyxobacter sp.]|nr:LysR substrate-binding domain-containing protein [Anaeromyxobacter sp.]
MKDATVRQLQIFDAAARTLSFSRAAEVLRLTQPAVSMQIRQLEHFAGVPLFERSGRRLHLTDAGDRLVQHARAVLRALEEADEAFAAMKGLRGGRLRLAVVSTAKYFAPRLIARFVQAHPGVEVRLQVDNRDAVVRTLAGNDVDLALMGRPPGELDLVAAPFAEHPHVIIAPPDHPLAHRRRVEVEALAAETFLVREVGSGTRTAMERFFQERGVKLRVGMEMPSNETIKQAVMAGLGLSFISLHTIALELAARALGVVHAPGLPVVRQWYVLHRADKLLSPAAEAFRGFVLQHGRSFLERWRGGA